MNVKGTGRGTVLVAGLFGALVYYVIQLYLKGGASRDSQEGGGDNNRLLEATVAEKDNIIAEKDNTIREKVRRVRELESVESENQALRAEGQNKEKKIRCLEAEKLELKVQLSGIEASHRDDIEVLENQLAEAQRRIQLALGQDGDGEEFHGVSSFFSGPRR